MFENRFHSLIKKKLFYLFFLSFFFSFVSAGPLYAGEAQLTWYAPVTNTDSSCATDLNSHKVYYGTSSGNYTKFDTVPYNAVVCQDSGVDSGTGCGNYPQCTYTVTGLTDGQTFFFVVSALDSSNNESGMSNEVSKDVPVPVVEEPVQEPTPVQEPVVQPVPSPFGVDVDFNADVKGDILWRDMSNGRMTMWFMDGLDMVSGGFTSNQIPISNPWEVAGLGDFNNDNKEDILWFRPDQGRLYVWIMDGQTFVKQASGPISATLDKHTSWRVVKLGDFNGDGKVDILWRDMSNGNLTIWFMDGLNMASGGFTTAQVPMSSPWKIAGVGDFNGDGKDEILWHRRDKGNIFVWVLNGLTFTQASGLTSAQLEPNNDWEVVNTGDFNGDGKDDILWRDAKTGATTLWVMDGLNMSSGGLTTAQVPASSPWKIMETNDFNGDGKHDILWHRRDKGNVFIWIMDGVTFTQASGLTSAQLEPNNDWVTLGR